MLARSLPLEANWMVFDELLLREMFTVCVFHVVHEPVGWNVMLVVTPLTIRLPVRELVMPRA